MQVGIDKGLLHASASSIAFSRLGLAIFLSFFPSIPNEVDWADSLWLCNQPLDYRQ